MPSGTTDCGCIRIALALLVAAVMWGSPLPVLAHVAASGPSGPSGFESGFTHPLTGADHFLAMFAVGVWGAQRGGRSVWTLPVTFPLIMVLGGVLAMAGVALPYVETGIALSVMVLGVAIALIWTPPDWIAMVLISAFALCHGYAHGAELPGAAAPDVYAVGFVLGTGFIHLIGIAVGFVLCRLWAGRLARGVGGAIALAGVAFLAG